MTEEQLIKIYNSILEENHELTGILVKQNLVSKTRSLELVYEYGISKENEENFIEKFKIYKERNKDYYIVSMNEIKKYQENGEVDVYNYEQNSCYFTQFVSTFPQYKDIINEIRKKANEINKEYRNSFLGTRRSKLAAYEQEFYYIYTSENPVEIYRKFDWDEKTFNRKMKCFKRTYNTEKDIELANYFEEQFKLYLQKYKAVKPTKLPFQCNEDNYSLAKSVIDDLIVSDKSIYEYCHEHLEYNVIDIKRFIRIFYTELGAGANKPDKIIKELDSFDILALYSIKNIQNNLTNYCEAKKNLNIISFYKSLSVEGKEKFTDIDFENHFGIDKNINKLTKYIYKGK